MTRRWAIRAATCLLLAVGAPGCDGDWSLFTRGLKPPAPRPMPLAQTVDQLRDWHARGAYGAMRPYIEPRHREDLIDLLVAMDELLAANQTALTAIRTACPGLSTERFDLSIMAENLDLFSHTVEVVTCREEGDAAIVTAKIGNRMPLAEVAFRRSEGFWLYCPGQGTPGVVDLLRQAARSLDQIALVASASSPTPEQIGREYELRVIHKLRQIDRIIWYIMCPP